MNGVLSHRAFGERSFVDSFHRAPLGWFSNAVGRISRTTLPRISRRPLYSLFARMYDVDLAAAELPLADYPTFGDFFARRLRPGSRPIARDRNAIVSPSDGRLACRGVASGDRAVQAKGRDYSLSELVCDHELADTLEGGSYLTFYLSPRDYHRVHAPIDGELTGYTWVPGAQLPVSPGFLRRFDNVFVQNERVVFRFDTALGPMALVMVAATGVGDISIPATGVDTRSYRGHRGPLRVDLAQPLAIERGQELAAFHLGSTVVLVFPPGAVELAGESLARAEVTPIRMGDAVARPVQALRVIGMSR